MAKVKVAKPLHKGRPPLTKRKNVSLSARTTRLLIRSHHQLRKAHNAALAIDDCAKVAEVQARIDAIGGIESYQLASSIGQSSDRGGDSSKVLVDWLQPVFKTVEAGKIRLRMLEVGALSTKNACSKVSCLDIERIDLRSQEKGIREIDFMELETPKKDEAKFHIISLSLVLNFVPHAAARGEMLKRIPEFLKPSVSSTSGSYLFLVLPLSCVENSRYLTERRLTDIMQSLGFSVAQIKKSPKLYYALWTFDDSTKKSNKIFNKNEIRPGITRNNFAIVLR